MVIAHIYPTKREAMYSFEHDLKHISHSIKKVRYNTYTTLDGDEHWYISYREYPRWAQGRTYMLDGKKMRGEVNEQDSN